MSSQKKILVDVDGTIADIHTLFSSTISKDFNVNFSVEDIDCWGFGAKARNLGLDEKFCVNLVHELWKEKWEEVALIDTFVVNVLTEIKQKHTVDIVTANESFESIRKWLSKNSVPHHSFIFHLNKHELDYDVFIEDNPDLHSKLKPHQTVLLKNGLGTSM